ncbi:hypothetical protein D9619_009379 [Psilocybe cf. subviscida]|uniref:Uncharacterized protein n=1 Tax=Psilocybe cf. subviscida TaxID=2480587 RepID=A0A8H5BVQ8_9AGAR|nr:hypothetical protein D9619_009379 [Psilocybe cf. subviscida]
MTATAPAPHPTLHFTSGITVLQASCCWTYDTAQFETVDVDRCNLALVPVLMLVLRRHPCTPHLPSHHLTRPRRHTRPVRRSPLDWNRECDIAASSDTSLSSAHVSAMATRYLAWSQWSRMHRRRRSDDCLLTISHTASNTSCSVRYGSAYLRSTSLADATRLSFDSTRLNSTLCRTRARSQYARRARFVPLRAISSIEYRAP